METVWFILMWFMLATYVVLDGFDLGVGMLHLWVAREDTERRQVIRSVGPVWDGNEVWLLAAVGTMVMAFPLLYATSFSGFYLPLMILLWLLMGRALGIELRHQMRDPLWTQFWDVVFCVSSLLLAVVLGAALGNVVRGVPLRADGTFFEPLWTDFRVSEHTGILDWYTLLVALTAAAALTHHGALWLNARTDGLVRQRAERLAARLWPMLAVLIVATTAASFFIQPILRKSLDARPWGVLFIVTTAAALIAADIQRRRGRSGSAFAASAVFLYGMVATVAVTIYPFVLPARDPSLGLTALDAAAHRSGLVTALWWWIPGMLLVCAYTYLVSYRTLPGTFSVDDTSDH